MRLIVGLAVLLINLSMLSQGDNTAQKVYKSSQDSVFLVYLNDSTGNPTALGSAFVVGPRTLVTNAHVVDAGDPVLAVGPVRIPVKILRKDETNDLAIITVSVDLTSTPLPLSKGSVSPGEEIFAIGNPEGLEKTISQGIISALRKRGDRDLLQITSPISHGSSGGPILDATGSVVGVAVGIYEEGQNLNFAVPARFVQELLDTRDESSQAKNARYTAAQVSALLAKKDSDQYSSDQASPYQQDLQQIISAMPSAIKAASTVSDLEVLACAGATEGGDLSDASIEAARKLQREHPSPESAAMLSYVLYARSTNEDIMAMFAKENSPEQAATVKRREAFSNEAYSEASRALSEAGGKRVPLAIYVIANIKEDRKDYTAAIQMFQQVVVAKPTVCKTDLNINALRSLVRDSVSISKADDAERWFRKLANQYQPTAFDWDSEGDRRVEAMDYVNAADAYERAAASGYYPADYCYASINRYFQPTTDGDKILADGRACVDASTKNTDQGKEKEYQAKLPIVYRLIAEVLNDRGAYPSAMTYVKQSLAVTPDDASSLYLEAKIYENLNQPTQCVSAAKAAISSSDGKFPYMHFVLGGCYFDLEDWANAEVSFRISAKADKTDAASAFNLALCLKRQGYGGDARDWFNEALARKPSPELREKILIGLGR